MRSPTNPARRGDKLMAGKQGDAFVTARNGFCYLTPQLGFGHFRALSDLSRL